MCFMQETITLHFLISGFPWLSSAHPPIQTAEPCLEQIFALRIRIHICITSIRSMEIKKKDRGLKAI